jgi:uncharacterized protein
MKMRADRMEGQNAIARHGAEGVLVNGVEYTESVVVPWAGTVVPWHANGFDELTADHFALRPLIDARIGVETMDTAAACRTYNVLLAESRSVVAALVFASADPGHP